MNELTQEVVKRLKEHTGLNGSQLAEKLKVQHTQFSNWQNGVTGMSLKHLKKHADLLNLKVSITFTRKGES